MPSCFNVLALEGILRVDGVLIMNKRKVSNTKVVRLQPRLKGCRRRKLFRGTAGGEDGPLFAALVPNP